MLVKPGRNVFEQEAAIFFLGAWHIANRVFDSIGPVSVMKIVRADEMASCEKTSNEANLLPGITLLAAHGLRTNEEGHR